MRDALLEFGTIDFASTPLPQTSPMLTGITFPNAINLSSNGNIKLDIGKGAPLLAELTIETNCNMATPGGGIDFLCMAELATNATEGGSFASQVSFMDVIAGFAHIGAHNNASVASGSYIAGRMTAGEKFYCYVPPLSRIVPVGASPPRLITYLTMNMRFILNVGATGGLTSGKVSAALVSAAAFDMAYPAGFSVT